MKIDTAPVLAGDWLEKAVALNPNGADVNALLGLGLRYLGRPEEAVERLEKAIRLNPMPSSPWYVFLSSALLNAGRYDEAVTVSRKAVKLSPNNIFAHLALVLSYFLGSRDEEGRFAAAEVLRIQPNFCVDSFAKRLPYKNPEDILRQVNM